MPTFLEITGEDISLLNDADFRSLIGLLCEADYRLAALSTKHITWGGNQDATDGGLDVVVRDEIEPPSNSFIPRSKTAFQVKKPDMSRANILAEMKPHSILRDEIKSLIRDGGAYIIVSSGSSTSERALNNRRNAMKEAVAEEDNHFNLYLDFYDRGRVATWVRSHPSLILWVRGKIGRQIKGWQPFGNWSHSPGNIQDIYLLDDNLRLQDRTEPRSGSFSVQKGLQRLRSMLSLPGKSVRITGLSGVGKTRFVQALFDEKIGVNALNPLSVFYTDVSDDPEPDPKSFAELLIAENKIGILVVDNCKPELHSKLTSICAATGSNVTLLSIEYDIRDDLPEETSVFRLEPASIELIEELVNIRFTHISKINCRTIAEFSGGNARIAIALANTVRSSESLSSIRNDELFKRLFWQRHATNDSLLESGKACSLVYSFEGTDVDSDKSELKILASLVGKSASELYKDVQILKERELIQSRDKWRAVLPHALANRLAQFALKTIPKKTIAKSFFDSGSERLIRSFSRRLSYLHESIEAIDIVQDWLATDGWIGEKNCRLSYFEMEVFRNIAPVCPEKILELIERASDGFEGDWFTSRDNPNYYDFVQILQLLAYEPEFFDRSVDLICRYALSEKPEERHNSTRDVLKSLFYPYYSGTNATNEVRVKFINKLLDSTERKTQELGLFLLEAALECWEFGSVQRYDFGARSRDYGRYPKTREEVIYWYQTFIELCTNLIISDSPISKQAKKILSDKFRGLWTAAAMYDSLEKSARNILTKQSWNEGWIAIKEIIRYDGKDLDDNSRNYLNVLEELLKPKDLLERARTYALTDDLHFWSLLENFEEDSSSSKAIDEIKDIIYKIGSQVAQNFDVFNVLLPEIISTSNSYIQYFGRGLAENCNDKNEILNNIHSQLKKTPKEQQRIGVLSGFLSSCAESDPEFYNAILDQYVNDDLLGQWYPILQRTATIDHRGVERLLKSLEIEKAHIDTYKFLGWGRAHESICDNELARLLDKILKKKDGIEVVMEILGMRFHEPGEQVREYSEELLTVARNTLSLYSFSDGQKRYRNQDYVLAQIANVCLKGESGKNSAVVLCKSFAEAVYKYIIYPIDYSHLLRCLSQIQPIILLDVILEDKRIAGMQRHRLFSDDLRHGRNLLVQISEETLLSWCDQKAQDRYPLVASAIRVFTESEEQNSAEWKPLAFSLFSKAPELKIVLESIAATMFPNSWSGSRARILQRRSTLFPKLYNYEIPEIRAWAKTQYIVLKEAIERDLEREENLFHKGEQSFE